MVGSTNLKSIINSLKIICDDLEYGFASITTDSKIDQGKVLSIFREKDYLTVIAEKTYLDSENIDNEGPFAKLTYDTHTSLELVGLTAVVTTKLAEHGISANVVAAFYHDHIFVQYEKRLEAMELLESLKDSRN